MQQMADPSPIRIAIIGAGPAGLLLARIIAREIDNSLGSPRTHFPFTITLFDRDQSPSNPLYRPQGGQLDLHDDSGQLAIREAGLWDVFIEYARYDAQGWRADDSRGNVVAQVTEEGGKQRNKPEIGRAQLRQLLAHNIDGLEGVEVRWGQKVAGVDKDTTGYKINVENSGISSNRGEHFDGVIGADGIWSHLRALVSNVSSICVAES
jgi:2-polyprenyl-6-methoxyphenol hydroxylase-like FAD-dependent oxidoreductase